MKRIERRRLARGSSAGRRHECCETRISSSFHFIDFCPPARVWPHGSSCICGRIAVDVATALLQINAALQLVNQELIPLICCTRCTARGRSSDALQGPRGHGANRSARYVSDYTAVVRHAATMPTTRRRAAQDESDEETTDCLLYTSPSPRDATLSRMPSSA